MSRTIRRTPRAEPEPIRFLLTIVASGEIEVRQGKPKRERLIRTISDRPESSPNWLHAVARRWLDKNGWDVQRVTRTSDDRTQWVVLAKKRKGGRQIRKSRGVIVPVQ